MDFADLQYQLYAFIGELFMTDGVESVAQQYNIHALDWVEVMDQAVLIETRNFFM